jgi:hypothetical protein
VSFMNSYGEAEENHEYLLHAASGTGPLQVNKRHISKATSLD